MGALRNDRVARYLEKIAEPDCMEELVQRVAGGELLPVVCAEWDVPYGRVMCWLMADADRFGAYMRALEMGSFFEVDEAKVIADGSEDAKLRVDVRFRRAKAFAPAVFGERVAGGGGQVKVVLVNFRQDEVGRVVEVEAEGERVAVIENSGGRGSALEMTKGEI
jgi:hypothetical protein